MKTIRKGSKVNMQPPMTKRECNGCGKPTRGTLCLPCADIANSLNEPAKEAKARSGHSRKKGECDRCGGPSKGVLCPKCLKIAGNEIAQASDNIFSHTEGPASKIKARVSTKTVSATAHTGSVDKT
jgi:hypothetical protein